MHFIHSAISIRRYMSVNYVKVRPDALACHWQPLQPYDFKGPQLSTCTPRRLCAAPSRASAARAAPRADCAGRPLLSGAWCRAWRYGRVASARAPYRGQVRHRPRDLRATEALSPDHPASEPVCVCEDKSRSVCQVRRNVNIVVHLFDQHILLLHSGEEG
jgi:hypothetical protein